MNLKLQNGFSLILAADQKGGIGKNNSLPWPRLNIDMKNFVNVTTGSHVEENPQLPVFFQTEECMKVPEKEESKARRNAVVMGRSTWESLPSKVKPLKDRVNVILTRDKESFVDSLPESYKDNPNIRIFDDIESMLVELDSDPEIRETIIIGGATIYKQCLESYKESLKYIVYTRINSTFDCDTFVDQIDDTIFKPLFISKTFSSKEVGYDICYYGNTEYLSANPSLYPSALVKLLPKHEEMQYLEAINEIIKSGNDKGDRTGVGVISKFGYQMRYDLSESFPLLTTKDVYWKGVVEELLWFLRGETNSKTLSEKKVRIWDGNGSREFLDKNGFTEREEGDLGPVYGFQWRHFGADYGTMHDDYEGKGVDQIKQIIKDLKENPTSRRILLNAWNVADLKKMALPPCHILCQFYVDINNRLSCQMYQRS